MRLTSFTVMASLLLGGLAMAHDGKGAKDWTGLLTPEVIEQRLKVMGYQSVKKTAEREDAIQFSVAREGRTWTVWISRRPLGPLNIASIDAVAMIEAQANTPSKDESPGQPKAPERPTTPNLR
jgi:hypothetical protein